METVWQYGGMNLEFDLDSMEGLERYDAALTAQKSAFTELPVGASEPRQVLAYCEGIRRLLDSLFGEGTADKLLKDATRPSEYDALYESFLDFIHPQAVAQAENRDKRINKYKPDPNREQRRAVERAVKKVKKAQKAQKAKKK